MHSTYHRFVCRLLEIVATCEKKNAEEYQEYHLYNYFIERLNNAVDSYRFNKNVGEMFRQILSNAQKFCIAC